MNVNESLPSLLKVWGLKENILKDYIKELKESGINYTDEEMENTLTDYIQLVIFKKSKQHNIDLYTVKDIKDTLKLWGISYVGFEKYAYYEIGVFATLKIEGKKARLVLLPPEKVEQLALDYINLRLSFLAIYNRPLKADTETLYRSNEGLYYPLKKTYYDFIGVVRYSLHFNGNGLEVKDKLLKLALERDAQNPHYDELQAFYEKYSEKAKTVVTDFDNPKEQIENFMSELRKGNIYPHYYVNTICQVNNFSVRSAYKYLRENPKGTIKGYISSKLAVSRFYDNPLDSLAECKDLFFVGDRVFSGVYQVKHYYEGFVPKTTRETYLREHKNEKGYAELWVKEYQEAHPNKTDEFILDFLVLNENPEEPLPMEMIQRCLVEVEERYVRGIIFEGVLYQSAREFRGHYKATKFSPDIKALLDKAFAEPSLLHNIDSQLVEEGLCVVTE